MTWSMPVPPMRSTPPEPDPGHHLALAGQARAGHPPPVARRADQVRVGDAHAVEEHLVEVDLAADVAQRAGPRPRAPCRSTMKYVRPWRFGHVGSVRARQTANSAEVRPRRPHLLARSGSTRRRRAAARVASDARSEPAPGSLTAAGTTSPRCAPSAAGSAARCSVGAVGEQRGGGGVQAERVEPAEVVRSQHRSATRACAGARSRPRYSTGQVGTASPLSANVGYQSSYSRRGRTLRIGRRPVGGSVSPCLGDVGLDPGGDGLDDLGVHAGAGDLRSRPTVGVHRPNVASV